MFTPGEGSDVWGSVNEKEGKGDVIEGISEKEGMNDRIRGVSEGKE